MGTRRIATLGAVGVMAAAALVNPVDRGVATPAAASEATPAVRTATATPAPPATAGLARLRWRLARTTSWTLALSDAAAASDLRGYSLVLVDGETTSAGRVRELRRNGSVVLAYLSIGTIEDGRWWSQAARGHRLDRWQDWGEWYADVNNSEFRALITKRVLPQMMAAGFDGVFLDNVDMVESHPRQRSGMASLLAAVSRDVHRGGRLVLAQNGDSQLRWVLPWLDGWNREDVSFTYDFDTGRYRRTSTAERAQAVQAIRRVRAVRLTAFSTDYLANPAAPAAARQVAEAVRYACAVGAKPYVGSIGLDRMPRTPLRC